MDFGGLGLIYDCLPYSKYTTLHNSEHNCMSAYYWACGHKMPQPHIIYGLSARTLLVFTSVPVVWWIGLRWEIDLGVLFVSTLPLILNSIIHTVIIYANE